MVDTVISDIIDIDQFVDSGIVSPNNEACGCACALMIWRWLFPDQRKTLFDVIKMTPLIDGQKGLPGEEVAELCIRLGMEAKIEFLNTDTLKAHTNAGRPVICLIRYDYPMKYKQDRFTGFHWVVCVGEKQVEDPTTHAIKRIKVICDPDRIDPHSKFGQDVEIPADVFDSAMATSDQPRMAIVIYGKINVEADYAAYVNIKGGANLRCYPTVNSIRLELIPLDAPVYVLKDAPVTDKQYTWRRVEVGDMLVGWMADKFLTEGQQPPMSITAPELWADVLRADPSTTVTFAVAGKTFTVKVSDITRTVNVATGSYLNVRAVASTSGQVIGKLYQGDRVVIPTPDKVSDSFVQIVAPIRGYVSSQWLIDLAK